MTDQATLRTIEKMGHGLQEVRQRALITLNTKLEHELLTIDGMFTVFFQMLVTFLRWVLDEKAVYS